jgi:hypothetical protein
VSSVEAGSDQGRPHRRWPLVAAIGWNIVLVVVAIASRSVVRNNSFDARGVVGIAGWFLLIGSLVALLASLLVWALLIRYDRTGSRRSLLAARILAGLVVGAGVGSMEAFVGLFMLPTGAALVLACMTRRDVATAEAWYPADAAQLVSK